MKIALPKMGIVRNASRQICLTQAISHIEMLIKHGYTKSPEGILISAMMELHPLEYGGAQSVLVISPSKAPWVLPSWFWFTLEEVAHYDFHLHAPPIKLHQWRERKKFLMGIFATLRLSAS